MSPPLSGTNTTPRLGELGPREFRILTLLPSGKSAGTPEAAVQCELRRASLDRPPKYEALSYAWGDPQAYAHIKVDGQDCSVTVTLEAALRRLRIQGPRTLWVDALCITQGDAKEKSVQVPLMGEIYANALRVLVWLGEASPETDVALKWATKSQARNYSRLFFI